MVGIRLFDKNANTVGVLELAEQTDFTFEENSSLFEDTGISGGFSAPGELPNTERNNAILQNAHILKRMQYITTYNCEVVRDNVPVYRGSFLLIEANNNTIQFSIAINGFNTAVFDKKLKDYNWPITTIYGPDDDTTDIVNYCSDKCKVVDWTEAFAFPVYYNPFLYGEGSASKNPNFAGWVNEWDDATQTLKYNTTDGSPADEDSFQFNFYALVPWFYVKWILNQIAIFEGYSIGGYALNAAEFEKLQLPNNTTLDKLSGLNYYVRAEAVTPNVFPTPVPTLPYTQSIVFDDETTPPNEDNSSSWNPSLGRYTIKKAGFHSFHTYLKFTLSWADVNMLIKVKRSDGTTVHTESVVNLNNNPAGQPGGLWFDIDIDFSTYASNAEIGLYYYVEIEYISITLLPGGTYEVIGFIQIANTSYKLLNVYSNVINPKNHLPDITVGDLFLLLRDIYGIDLEFDRTQRKILVGFTETDLNAEPAEITPGNHAATSPELTVPEKYILRYKEKTEYSYAWDFGQDATADEFITVDRSTVIGSVVLEADLVTTFPNANIGDIAYVEHTQRYYIRKTEEPFPQLLWRFHSYAYGAYATGDKPVEKKPICSPMVTVVQRVPGESYSRMITQVKEIGTSLAFDTGENNPSVKLVYWHGRQYNNTGYLYPMATSGAYDYNTGSLITGNEDGQTFNPVVAMEWGLLFNAFWLSFYRLMQAPHEVEMQALATLGFLRGLNLRKPITINHTTYMVKTARYPLLPSGPLPTTLILAKKMPTI